MTPIQELKLTEIAGSYTKWAVDAGRILTWVNGDTFTYPIIKVDLQSMASKDGTGNEKSNPASDMLKNGPTNGEYFSHHLYLEPKSCNWFRSERLKCATGLQSAEPSTCRNGVQFSLAVETLLHVLS